MSAEYKELSHGNGMLYAQYWKLNGEYHGVYKSWYENGQLSEHSVYVNSEKLDIDVSKLTEEDKILLSLQYGINKWL